uniref:Minor tail protein n=1 Tax=Streptomyces sp. NBC_00003 TaxID=2903608 RepID=A0AAU2V6W2_9ACTN
MAPGYRYLAQHALTGELIASDLPLTDVEFGPQLNGPGSLTAKLEPRFARSLPEVADEGNVCLYVERDGFLRWGGLLWQATPQNRTLSLEAAGWSSYLQHRHDIHGELDGRGPYVNADPCRVIRDIWAYAQSLPDGDLGVQVDAATSTAKVGTPAEPYRFNWWEDPVLGNAIDDLVKANDSPDYTCDTAWGPDDTIVRRLRLAYPRLGARRTDISFASGINIIDAPPVTRSADEYAQTVIATGAGEGRAKGRVIDSVRDGRLRLEHVLDLPDVKGTDILAQRARAERIRRQTRGSVDQIRIRPDHPAAPLGSWQVGDDVQVAVHNDWTSWSGWCRITGWTVRTGGSDGETVTVDLARADSFHYGPAAA